MSGAQSLRLWGKIYGSEKDYMIVEGELKNSEEGPRDDTQEARGDGCNRYVYWVSDNVLHDWIQLPEVLPSHINSARLIKHVFTGNLNAEIDSNPTFHGKERHYLRA
jgi:radial spoke head protein 4A